MHVDAYRLGGVAELDDLDLDTSLEDAVTVVEWGEGIAEGLADDRLEVRIERAFADEAAAAGELDPRRVRVSRRWGSLAGGRAAQLSGAASAIAKRATCACSSGKRPARSAWADRRPGPYDVTGLRHVRGRAHLFDSPHLVLFPAGAVMLAVLSFNFIGDGLRDYLDPRSRIEVGL